MRVPRLVLATLALTTGVASADPSYGQPLDSYTLNRAKNEVAELARTENIDADTAALLLKLDVFATSSDTGCPGVDVDVLNGTNRTVWNIEVVIEQKDGGNTRTEKVHLPYMLAKTKAQVTVSCLTDYSSRYSYGGSTPISLSYSAKGSKSIDEALPLMQLQMKDYTDRGLSVSPSPAGTTTLLEHALALDDSAVARELVLGIARTGVGGKELGDAVTASGSGDIADEVVASMKKLPPAQQAQLARTLLASSVADRWSEQLTPMIDRQLCSGARGDVIGLWIQAQGEDGIPIDAYRNQIREKCKPTKADGPGLIAALEKDATRAGPVLDAVDLALFESALASWKNRKDKDAIPTSMGAYLKGSQIAERFDQAAALIPAGGHAIAMGAVAQSPEGAAAAHKAAWLDGAMKKIAKDDVASTVASLTDSLINGSIPVRAMRDAVKALAAYAPETAEGVIVTFANKSSYMFDVTKLQAGGIDISEFLAFNATLGSCNSTVQTLAECADKIATYKDKAGLGALQKVVKTAVKPEFLAGMKDLITPLREPAGLIEIAGKLKTAGFDVGFIADRACTDARDAVRYDDDPEEHLALVEKIDPGSACIEDTKDAASSKHRKAILLGIFAIVGLIVPVPAGTWVARRRWRKLQKQLPAETVDEATTGVKLDDRLGANGVGRVVRDGVAEARRELAGTAISRSLETVDEALLAAATATVARAVKAGDAATLIVRRASDAVYLVALPVRHPRPQVVQRYLGAPWPEHLAQIQRAAGLPVLALIVLCGPDAAEASLVVAHNDGASSSDPDALLDAREARDRGANRFRYVMTLAEKAA